MAKRGSHARQQSPLIVLVIFVMTGFLFVAASVSADGTDLRPAGGDTASLLQERSQRIDDRRDEARDLRAEIDDLSSSVSGTSLDKLRARVKDLEPATGLTAVEGPGIRVTLTDAPDAGKVAGVDPNLQIVHQQDIQAYVNALWAGGAEAVSLQGQRLIGTSSIKCVGSVVIIDGVTYAPPYVIEAIGDQSSMGSSLVTSPDTASYATYVVDYDLGLEVEQLDRVGLKAYANPVSLTHATVSKP